MIQTKPHNFKIVNGDTDSISFCNHDGSYITPEQRLAILKEINEISPELIEWEDDDFFPRFIVVGAKNYILLNEEGNLTVKGSGLKATTKEKALRSFINEVIQMLLTDRTDEILELYFAKAREILSLKDMSEWSTKHTITKAVLEGKGTAQVRIREALKGRPVQDGDKLFLFFKSPTERCLVEDFDGTYDASILLGKLYDTLCMFETVLDIKQYPNLTLKRPHRDYWEPIAMWAARLENAEKHNEVIRNLLKYIGGKSANL